MTQRSVTYLKGRFETGDIPTQSDYGDLMDSFVNLEASAIQTMSGTLFAPIIRGRHVRTTENVSPTGTTQGSAAAVSADTAQVSAEQEERACVIAALEPGRQQLIVNTGTTVLQVYPPTGQNFIGTAANGGINCAVNQSVLITHLASAYSIVRGS